MQEASRTFLRSRANKSIASNASKISRTKTPITMPTMAPAEGPLLLLLLALESLLPLVDAGA
jgi:hypothetical protein